MSEPFGNKWKQYIVWPKLLNQSGTTVEKIKLNIGDPSSLIGPQGVQGVQGTTGIQGPSGNPSMQLTAPNGNVYEITVDNAGVLSTVQISSPGGGGGTSI